MGNEYILTPDGELYHWGIKGMKWGQRRYQNKDGSLTPAGKKRYAKEEAQLKEREKLIKNREREAARRAKLDSKKAELDARESALNSDGKKAAAAKDSGKAKPKSIKDMRDEELNEAIQRARMEDAYRNLRPDPVAKPSFGKRLVSDVVTPALMTSGRKALESVIDKTVKDLLKDKADPNSLEALKKTAEKLELQRKIEKLKKGEDPNEKPLSWEDKLKKQQWEMKEEERAAKKAEEATTKAKQESEERHAEAKRAADAKAEYDRFKESLINERKAAKAKREYETFREKEVNKHAAEKKAREDNRQQAEILRSDEKGLTVTDRLVDNLGRMGRISDMERSSTAKRGKEAFQKLNDRINWDEYLWDDDV